MDRPTLVTQLLLVQHGLVNTQMALLARSLAISLSLSLSSCTYETKKEREPESKREKERDSAVCWSASCLYAMHV